MERFGISVSGQLLEAVRFAGVGVLLGVWYDLFRLWRLLARPRAAGVFLQDVLYFAWAAVITLLAALPISDGQVRFFHLLGIGVGFGCYYHTAGRLVFWAAKKLAAALLWISGRCRRAARRLFSCVSPPVRKFLEKIGAFFKKSGKIIKNRLQLSHKV